MQKASSRTRHGSSVLTFDRGTLVLHPPPSSAAWAGIAQWDDRIERLRAPAMLYRLLLEGLSRDGVQVEDRAAAFAQLEFSARKTLEPYPHQSEAVNAWIQAGRRGVVVLPTGAGKTFVAIMAMRLTKRSTLVCVPTIDLLHQWYANLEAHYGSGEAGGDGASEVEARESRIGLRIGLLGGGTREITELTVATYDSAVRVVETQGNRFGLIVFDEVHHLPGDLYRLIAESSLAPYRLGLTATPERGDGRHRDLETLVGPIVYRIRPEELAGGALAPFELRQVSVELNPMERTRYEECIATRDRFLRERRIRLFSLEGWSRFVRASAGSSEGRRAMLAHREARRLALASEAKLRELDRLLALHHADRVLVFTDDNTSVYEISRRLLLPAITHQTPVLERHAILERFRSGVYPTIVASRVLNEGVDVPDANVAIVLSGTGSTREMVQRLGRVLRQRADKRAVLYEVVAQGTLEEGIARRRAGLGAPPVGASPVCGDEGTADSDSAEKAREGRAAQPSRLEFAPIDEEDVLEFDDLGQ